MSLHSIITTLTLISFITLSTSTKTEETQFCGYDHITYPSVEAAHLAGTGIMNCGPCGKCSTLQDVELYWKTKEDLTKTSRSCAWRSIFSEKWSRNCMQREVGFTDECMDCWMENILCDRKHCAGICIYSLITNEPYVDENGNWNKCLQCDEVKCGSAFKSCAGANRRRSCIASDIFRDKDTICKVCDPIPELE